MLTDTPLFVKEGAGEIFQVNPFFSKGEVIFGYSVILMSQPSSLMQRGVGALSLTLILA